MIFNSNTKQISFVIVFLFALINSCLANENVDFFSSSGIKVNLSFSNETDIRNTAISKAEEIAFKRVSVKLLTPEDYKKLSKLKDIDISYFVESIEFVDEKFLQKLTLASLIYILVHFVSKNSTNRIP